MVVNRAYMPIKINDLGYRPLRQHVVFIIYFLFCSTLDVPSFEPHHFNTTHRTLGLLQSPQYLSYLIFYRTVALLCMYTMPNPDG